MHKMFVCLLSG